jgi:hypothetical protein
MNKGERHEIIAILTLAHACSSAGSIPRFGQVKKVQPVSDRVRNYNVAAASKLNPSALKDLPAGKLMAIAKRIGVKKAPSSAKADVKVNGRLVSLKSLCNAPPALVNHTTRPGWEFAAAQCGGSLSELDKAVARYWRRRKRGLIGEDVLNCGSCSPFWAARKEIEPLLVYFMFKGTGTKCSVAPASLILEFGDPTDLASWRVRTPRTVVNHLWCRLVFSVRSKKGMPKNYPSVSARYANTKSSIARWTVYWQNEHRGALHVRVR